MKIVLLLALALGSSAAQAKDAAAPTPKEPLSVREMIQENRAKAKAEEDKEPKERFWDRDADGKRPWDPKVAAPK
jgi:hypothetical protein